MHSLVAKDVGVPFCPTLHDKAILKTLLGERVKFVNCSSEVADLLLWEVH